MAIKDWDYNWQETYFLKEPIKVKAGTKFEVVSGYKGTIDVGLAMERGEVDGMCGWDWSSVKSQKSDWISEKKVNVLVQVSLEPLEELTERGVPHIWQFVLKADDRRVAELVVSQQAFDAWKDLPNNVIYEAAREGRSYGRAA